MFHWGNLLQHTGSIFKALIRRTDGCTEVLWLLTQTHHIIRCSHKRYKNRPFNQHMIFRYCERRSGEPVQTCRLPRAFAPSTRDLNIYYIVQWLCLRKCADSPEYSLLAWIEHKSPFKAAQEILYSSKAKVSLCKCADSPDPSLLAQNGVQSPFESPHENFELWRRLRLDQANVQTRQSHRCSHECHPNSKWVSQSQTADKPMPLRGIATQQSRDTRVTKPALSLPHQDDHKTIMDIK